MIFPVVLGLPAMVFAVPPLMVSAPATLAFGVQIPAAVFGGSAVLAMVVDRFIESDFSLFDGMLAFLFFVGVHERRCHEQ